MAASATPVIELWNDIVNNRLIVGRVGASGWDGQDFRFTSAKIYQSSKLSFRWYPIKPNGFQTFIQVPIAGLTLDLAIGPRAGVEAILARQNVWADSGQGYLEATLNLNTTELNTAMASADTLSTFLEIQLTENGNARPVFQESITIQSVVIGPAGSSALPGAAIEYLTAAQIRAEFVRFFGNAPGSTLEFISPDGSKSRLLGVNNDGSAKDEISQ